MTRRPLLLESCEDRILCDASLFPVTAPVYLQTSGQSAGATIGDWYTASETSSTDRAHYIAVEVTDAMLTAGGGSVGITVNDADTAPGGNDEVRGARDPARFTLLAADRATVASAAVTVPNTAADGTNVTFNVTAAGIYYVKAETGARPISGDATVGNNDDDNSYTISVSQSGGALGSYQSSYQQSVAGTREFYFFVGPGTSSLYLRNFDVDGGASAITYVRPNGTTVAGTVSGNGVWNGAGGTLNSGGDTITGLTNADAGVWTYRVSNWTADNQTSFEANTGAGQRLVLSDVVSTRAGNFAMTANTSLYTSIGTPVDHAFTVRNNFLTSDIINFTLSGTAANYTAQLFTSGGVALTDTDGDGKVDTGVIAARQTGNYILRVTPNAGAGATDTTRVSGVSFMDTKVDAANNTTLFVDKTTSIYSTISGTVYNDADNNGVKGGSEVGISGVNVRITGTDVAGAAVNTTVATNASGVYSFASLRAANASGYTITELAQPSGFVDGTDVAGTAGGTAANPGDSISGILLGAGSNATGYNFGEVPPTLSISNPTVTEGTANFAVFMLSLNTAPATAVTVSLGLTAGTATGGGTDYGAAGVTNLQVSTNGTVWSNATSVTFAAGATTVFVRTPINNDLLDEASENFTLTATRTAGTTTNASATGTATITDNDPAPSLAINDVTFNEGAGTATFTVTLSAASGLPVSVGYATSSGTAVSGTDFTGTSGTLNFAVGVVSQTITVPILNDTIFENSERFNMLLSGAVNATIADGLGVGTIRDNGTGGGGTDNDTPTASVTNATVTEGTNPHAVFTISLSNTAATPTVFGLALTAGTATGGGTDFGAGLEVSTDGGANWSAGSSATIAAGSLSVLVRTPINNDALDENAETFTLTVTRTAGTTTNASVVATATINDDDAPPAMSINDVAVNEAAGTATFTVTLSAPSGLPVSVNYATSSGTATSGADFMGASGTLNFAAGVISQTITVTILNDATFENSEAFNMTLSAPTNATIADGFGVGTITDDGSGSGGSDNDTPTVSITDPAVSEGTDNFAVFTLALSNLSTTAVAFNLTLVNGTATGGGTDFGAGLEVSTDGGTIWTPSTTATLAAGSLSVLVRTPINNDLLDEVAENFTLTATRTSGATTNATATGTATIADNDPPPTLSINDVSVNEGAGTATFTVTLDAPSSLPITVNYATSNGTATAGADFLSKSGTLTFAAGVTSQTLTVALLNDGTFEGSETFNVLLSAPLNATIADSLGIGTIYDDGTGDGGTNNDTPTLTVSSSTATEGVDGHAVFAVSLSNLSTTAVIVSLALADGTGVGGGTDYGTSGAGNLQVSTNGGSTWADANSATIAAGTLSVLVRTPVANDALDEAPETFTLTATRTAGATTNAAATGTATIADNDPAPSLAINDVTFNEGAGTATFTVTLGVVSGQTVTVNYATNSGTATGGVDFATSTGTLTFAAGVTSQTITVPIINDVVFEGSESFTVLLSAAVNATIADGVGVGTILDDGTGFGGTNNDTPTLNVSNVTASEGGQTHAVFSVSLSNLSTTNVSVALALASGTATAGGVDFGTAGLGNLQVSTDNGASWSDATSATILAGTMSVLVRTPIINDALAESTEQFTLTATRTAGATTNTAGTGTADIIDNDGAPVLLIDDVTVNEAAGTATFTVSLSAVSGQDISVNYTTVGGTAAAGADFSTTSGVLNFAAGVLSQTVTVTILDDAVYENSEAFTVLLSGAVNAGIADATGVGTILDDGTGAGGADNDRPALAVSNVTVAEDAGHAVFSVSLSNLSTTPVSVSLALTNGTAVGGGVDFSAAPEVSTDGGTTWNSSTTATIAAGSLSVLVRTPITNDLLNEAAETFALTATRTSGATLNATATGTATITDNDATPTLVINDVTVNEAAGTATFTVTLNAPSGQVVTVDYATGSGTATSGADFTGVSGTLTFAAGVTSQTITVAILNDTTFENSEAYEVMLSGATNATITDATGVGTILDNGTGSGGTDNDRPSFAVSSLAVTEGVESHAVFAVSLSNGSTTAVIFNLALVNGTAVGGGTDYGTGGAGNLQVSTDGGGSWTDASSVTIDPGSLSVLVRTPITNDALNEVAETFTLTVTRTAGTTTNASATGTVTITDNDALPSVVIDDVTINEGAGVATFTVTLSGASGQTVAVNYATSAGTATAGADFTAKSGTLIFTPGVTSQTVSISILDDAVFENSEAFLVVLSAPTNATIADTDGQGTIRDDGTGLGGTDNDTPTLAITDVNVTEGTDAFAVFTVTLSNASTTAVDLALALTDDSALGLGTDYGTAGVGNLEVSTDNGASWADVATASFAPGSTSLLVRTPIVNDALFETLENFTLTAARTAGTTTNTSVTGTATLADDDGAPTLSVNNVTVNEAAGTATFTVTLSAPSGLDVEVNYATASGTATAGADFIGTSGTLFFAAGETTQTFTVSILDDPTFENSESFTLLLSGAVNATIADATGIGTILDNGGGLGGTDNDTPLLSVSDVSVTEGASTHAVFLVSLSNPATTAVSLSLSLTDGTATGGGTDFGAGLEVSTDSGLSWSAATSAVITAGNTSVLVRTPITNDLLDEVAETFILTATRTAGPTSNASATGTVTITDNDPPPQFSIDDVAVNEAAGTMTFTVTLDAPSSLATSVSYTLNDGSAAAGADFTAVSGVLNFAAGVTSQTIVVPILNDTIFEGSETFNVTLSGATNATIADATGVGLIFDDGTGAGGTDNDIPALSVSSPAVAEGVETHAVFTVSLSNPSTTAVDVNLALADGTAVGLGTDYGAGLEVSTDGGTSWSVASNVSFAPGATSVLVRTPVINDPLDEVAETFTLTATVTGGTTSNTSAAGTATIADNDAPPALSINGVSVNEDAGTITFTVTLNAASGQTVSVNYATADGTATAGSDYTAGSGTLTFAPGTTSQTVTLLVADDSLFEQSESFTVTLSGAVNASIATATGTGTILDDGTGSGGTDDDTPTLSVTNTAATEGVQSHAVFTVSLSQPSTTPVEVSLVLADSSALGGGTDYGAGGAGNLQVSTDGGATWSDGATVTFAPGTTTVLARTPINDDALDESSETFTLTATRTSGTTTNLAATATATITDNDPTPSLAISDVTVNEQAGTASFTVTLSAPSGRVVSVDFATGNDTATAGADYVSGSGTLTFALGATSQTITVPILDDAIFESSETFTVTLTGAVNATIADGTGAGTILDDGSGAGGTDNDTPSLGVSNVTLTENAAGFAIFTVSLSNAATTDVSVALALADGTAVGAGTDYGTAGLDNLQVSTDGGASWSDATTATIAAGSTSILVRTPITDDVLSEASETFTLTATRLSGPTVNATAMGTATIDDNEALPSLVIDDLIINEGRGTATFTVTLNAPSGRFVTVDFAASSGTATSGVDFAATSGSLIFGPGVTSQTISVPILGDTVFEGSENFTVLLSAAVNATISDGTGSATILDDGTGAGGTDDDRPTLSVANVSVTEGVNSFAVFTVSLSNLSTTDVSLALAFAADTASGAAEDFGTTGAGNLQVSTDGGASWADATTATIAAGSGSVLVRTPIANDTFNEASEAFTLTATRTAGTTTNAAATGTATISDDDGPPTLTIDDVTVNEAAGTATFTVTLSAVTSQTVTVNYATANGTAAAGSDFTATSGVLTFGPGDTSQTLTVPILDDGTFESSETFFVLLSGAVNGTIADDTGVGTINDDGTGFGGTDDDTPTLSVSSPVVMEGTHPHAVFTVALSNVSTSPVDVGLVMSSGSATGGGTDYGAGNASNLQVSTNGGASWSDATTVTIAAGQTSVLVRTAISDDLLDEPLEEFSLSATVITGATSNAGASGTATITDDDAAPSLAINGVTVNEGAGTATFTVTLSAASGQTVTVNYATGSGTATSGADFTGATGTLTFLPGETSRTLTVTILNDTTFEGSESFNVTLSGETNATLASAVGVGTILDDGTGAGGTDNDLPAVSMADVSVTEDGDSHAVFTLTLSNPATMAISFDLALAEITAISGGTDFGTGGAGNLQVSTDGGASWVEATSVTFAPGATAVLVRTPIASDALDEAAETFTLTATRTSGPTSNTSVVSTATVNDDDVAPGLSINDVTINEAAGTATFTVTMSAPSGRDVAVDYATGDSTATAGADYTGNLGMLIFAPGVTSQTITVSILNDSIFEGSEGFTVTLSNPMNASLTDGSGTGTILDDGTGAGGVDDDRPQLSVSDAAVTEGVDGYAQFTVQLSNPASSAVVVEFVLNSGTALGGGADYGAADASNLQVSTDGGASWNNATSAIIAAGTTSVLVRTPLGEDLFAEAVEIFTLTATRTVGPTANAAATGTATVTDNDANPTVSIDDVTVNEAAGTVTFTVALSGPSGLTISVDYGTSDGAATDGADYTGGSGTVNFAPGETTQTITLPILDDATFEGAETFTVTLSNPVNTVIVGAPGTGTIMDDGTGVGGTNDDTPTLSVSSIRVLEGTDLFGQFTVTLSNPSGIAIDVDFVLLAGTALGGGIDFGAPGAGNLQISTDGGVTWVEGTSATFAPGMTSILVRTPIVVDQIAETDETFTLQVTVTSGPMTNAIAQGMAMVTDPTVAPLPAPSVEAAAPAPFVFAFDSFRNFARPDTTVGGTPTGPFRPMLRPIDVWRPAMLPLAPIYAGEADPGATLVIDLYNANGVHIGSQTVMADAGGNWLANFSSTVLRDAPSDVRIQQISAPYSFGSNAGHNLRAYYAPAALNPGHFLAPSGDVPLNDDPAPLLHGLDLANPLQLGPVKYGGEFLPSEGVASGK